MVIAIIGVLMGLFMPAVQSAREAARRTACANQIGQLAKALLLNEAAFGSFPSGGWGNEWLGVAERGSEIRQPGGWTFAILPFLEEQALARSIEGATADTAAAAYTRLVSTRVPAFNCPTRRGGGALPLPRGATFRVAATSSLTIEPAVAMRIDYAANSGAAGPCPSLAVLKQAEASSQNRVTICHSSGLGHDQDAGETTLTLTIQAVIDDGHADHPDDHLGPCDSCDVMPVANPATLVEGDAWTGASLTDKLARLDGGVPDVQDGVFFRMSFVAPAHIRDGLSHTYLVGEKYVAADRAASGTDGGDTAPAFVGFAPDNLRWTARPPARDEPGVSRPSVFGSAHPSTWTAAFADGSVRSLSFDIDPEVHRILGSRADGTLLRLP